MTHVCNFNENVNKLDELNLNILVYGKPVDHNHVSYNVATAQSHIPRILKMGTYLKYTPRKFDFKRNLHWGQLKLFLAEVEFLTKAHAVIDKDKPTYFIYAGAAPGHHIYQLHDMFKDFHFELYDPNKFVIENRDKINTHQEYFTDDHAEYWRGFAVDNDVNLLFCSDIRTEPADQTNIIINMEMQKRWYRIMSPVKSMFKFRLPWEPGTTTYLSGVILTQAFPGPTSSETRLIVDKDAPDATYDNTTYENACFAHNCVDRSLVYKTRLGHLNIYTDLLCNCLDCSTFINIIDNYYINVLGTHLTNDMLLTNIKKMQNTIHVLNYNILVRTKKQYEEALYRTHLLICKTATRTR